MAQSIRASALVGVLVVSALSIGVPRATQAEETYIDNRASSAVSRIKVIADRAIELESRLALDAMHRAQDAILPIARKADGSMLLMDYALATKYCKNRGGLPTAKQLALVYHPKGVSYTAREGFYSMVPSEPDFFYQNWPPRGQYFPQGNNYFGRFWSSSVRPDSDGYYVSILVFDGYTGEFQMTADWAKRAVRCAGLVERKD